MSTKKEISYVDAGVDYSLLDAFKRRCMEAARTTDTFMERPPSAELQAARAELAKQRAEKCWARG